MRQTEINTTRERQQFTYSVCVLRMGVQGDNSCCSWVFIRLWLLFLFKIFLGGCMECKTKIASKVVEEPVSQKSILQVPASVTCLNSNDKDLQLLFTFIFFSCQKLLKAVEAKAQCWLSWGVRIAFMGFSLGQLDILKGSDLLGRSIRCTVTPSVTLIQLIEQPSLVRCCCIWTRDQHFKGKVSSFCSKSTPV